MIRKVWDYDTFQFTGGHLFIYFEEERLNKHNEHKNFSMENVKAFQRLTAKRSLEVD